MTTCATGQQSLSFPDMNWNIDKTREQYNIAGWSAGYLDVGEDGHLLARPAGVPGAASVDLYELAHKAREAGLSWPVLVRFTDILHQQVDRQCRAFRAAMKEIGYDGRYTAVYPIVITSYSIHYTKLYESAPACCPPLGQYACRRGARWRPPRAAAG